MLTIPEELLLLTVSDDAGGFVQLPLQTFNSSFAGAAIMELALRDRIDADLDKIWIVDAAPTDEACINPVLSHIQTPGFDFRAEKLIEQLAHTGAAVREMALERLCERGVLTKREDKILWVFRTRTYPLIDGQGVQEIKMRLLAILLGDGFPSPREACLLALADASNLIGQIVPPPQVAQARARLETIARLELLGQSVKHYLTLWRAAMTQALAVAPI